MGFQREREAVLMIDLSTVQYLEIDGKDFIGKRFAIVNNEKVDTGAGVLNSPIMPLPTLLLDIFGTKATFYIGGTSVYDPDTGDMTVTPAIPVPAKIYPESYTLEESSKIPEVLQGDIRVYVPGQAFGYSTVALLILQVRQTGDVLERIG
jgi:hypothetical protein